MAAVTDRVKILNFSLFLLAFVLKCSANDILGCGGFLKSHVNLDFSKIEIGLYTKDGSLKEKTECAPTNGYYFLPLYEKGEYVLKVHPPPGWSFQPSLVEIVVDGLTDQCSAGQDINFSFNGFGITGKVITASLSEGPKGVTVQLVNDKGDKRETVTNAGGDFHFTPVIPGKYTVKASHPKWKLEPSQSEVQVKEGNTALPVGALAVKGYDVQGSVAMSGNPVSGFYVLLYSKEERPKYRVEGCTTALLQGVPDAPICYSVTDASGEFSFGLVPAGDYKLLALAKPPGQAIVTYNVKPESVDFSVRQNSQFIKDAFEVTGLTVVGVAVSGSGAGSGAGVRGARVSVAGRGAGVTDEAGKYTLPGLKPGTYAVGFQHEDCEFDDIQLSITPGGAVSLPEAKVARWKVCGVVTPTDTRDVTLTAERSSLVKTVTISPEGQGKWCTYLPPGVYTVKVEVSEQEQRDGLQFYPVTERVTVAHGPVSEVTFSQLYATVSGSVQAPPGVAVRVRLSQQARGEREQAVVDGTYSFADVVPGTAELSLPVAGALCWERVSHTVRVSSRAVSAPLFRHTGYALSVRASHDLKLEYSSATTNDRGTLDIRAGDNRACVASADRYTLVARSCHKFQQPTHTVDTSATNTPKITLTAIAHAVVIKVFSPEQVPDLVLRINAHDLGSKEVGPLSAEPNGDEWLYAHTMYMRPGEISLVSATSSSLLFSPATPQQVSGVSWCQAEALTLVARPGLTLAGNIVPPVDGVTVTLTSEADNTKQTLITGPDGRYSFGPLDAAHKYTITAEKESYVMSPVQPNGEIIAHKLAEIVVELRDEATGALLQGALVSVSGGSYRRNLGTDSSGSLRFSSLSPGRYYVKPLMKEYSFNPPHHLLDVVEGNTHQVTLSGTRVAWSCSGRLSSLSGAGWAAGALVAAPRGEAARCRVQDAVTDPEGYFRIRGLLPKCVYDIQLKETSSPELAGLKLTGKPVSVEIKDNKDVENVRLIAIQPVHTTDCSVIVRAKTPDHYRTLRLTLAKEDNPTSALYSTRLEPASTTVHSDPGLLYVLPRLPADNNTYMLVLESTLSKATHEYENKVEYFVSDGRFKSFNLEFVAKVKSSEQELRQTSLLVVPLLALISIAFFYRERLIEHLLAAASAAADRAKVSTTKTQRPELLDKASIDQIVSSVNAAGKKTGKRKTPFSN